MDETIKKSIIIIEDNLHNRLSIEIISEQLGYSKYHFSKLFKKNMGITVHNYVTNRRLICSAKDILKGEKIVDIAMNYGYETQSGYSKAFVKKFGFPPNMLHAMRLIKELFSEIGGRNMNYEQLYSDLRNTLNKKYSKDDIVKFDNAYKLVLESLNDKKRYSGEPYIIHPLSVAKILETMDLPIDTVILGLLHETISPDSKINKDKILNEFGENIYQKIHLINNLDFHEMNVNQIFSEYDDDIIMIKLADRLHNMKTLKHLSQTRWKEKAQETMNLFLPIASAMELEELKMELEHLSLEYM
ncbi:MAG: HD domain-containing protein [Clostridiales bacterium]|nr:HD domain-containing protein [Clostridiales bacterium]